MADNVVRIGGASGYWGDAAMATPQLLAGGNLDYLVYDYLAEVTMSILARARAHSEAAGYATDFVTAAMKPNLGRIAAQGVKVIANAGGVNPNACADALRALIRESNLGLKVAVVTGDNLTNRAAELHARGVTDMFKGTPFPDPDRIASINAYLGAFPIAAALARGADIVITGRCVDSAVTLGGLHSCVRLAQFRFRPAGRRQSRRPHPGMRHAGDRRQLHGLGIGAGHDGRCGLSDRRSSRGRTFRLHQDRRHGRRGHDRHRCRTDAL